MGLRSSDGLYSKPRGRHSSAQATVPEPPLRTKSPVCTTVRKNIPNQSSPMTASTALPTQSTSGSGTEAWSGGQTGAARTASSSRKDTLSSDLQNMNDVLMYPDVGQCSKELLMAIRDLRKARPTKHEVQRVCSLLKAQYGPCVDCWAADIQPNGLSFVIEREEIQREGTFIRRIGRYPLVFRYPDPMNSELRACVNRTIDNPLPKQTREKVDEIIKRNYERLMQNHSNLIGVRRIHVKSSGFSEGSRTLRRQACIALLVHCKGAIPFGESAFERTIEGITTVVIEVSYVKHYHPASHRLYENLTIGMNFNTKFRGHGTGFGGTVGSFIEYTKGGNPHWTLGVITCAHVALKTLDQNMISHGPLPEAVDCQFAHESGRYIVFGQIKWHSIDDANGIDVAIIELPEARNEPTDGMFPDSVDAFQMYDVPMMFRSGAIVNERDIPKETTKMDGQYVVKYGATSGLTVGHIINHCNPNGYIEIHNESNDFSYSGDSGAPVFLVNVNDCLLHGDRKQKTKLGNQARCSCVVSTLGIVVAGYRGGGISLVMSIEKAFKALKNMPESPFSNFRLKTFHDKTDSTPKRRSLSHV